MVQKHGLQELLPLPKNKLNKNYNSSRIDLTKSYWINTHLGGKFDVRRLAHNITQKQRNRIRLLMGHIPFGSCDLLESPCQYMTVLREPRARLISEVHWIQFVFRKDPIISNLSTSEFIEGLVTEGSPTERFCKLIDNHETRLLSNDGYNHILVNQNISVDLLTPCRQLTQKHAADAIANMQSPEMVQAGILERLDVFFQQLGEKIGIDFSYNGTLLNDAATNKKKEGLVETKTTKRENDRLSRKAEALVVAMTRYDTQVYKALIQHWSIT